MSGLFKKVFDKIKDSRLFEKGDKVLLACSGGPDSLALLEILARLRTFFNLKITVAYFNHGIRPGESKKERVFVQRLSKKYGLGFRAGKGNAKAFSRKKKISLQEAGRYLRYNFFFETGRKLNVRKIVLAHHRDDSVETALLGIFKGAGLRGVSGIEEVRKQGRFFIIRPLLYFSKRDILSYLSAIKSKPLLDSSNLKEKYLRNRIRLKILPVLRKEINPRVDESILRLCRIYSEEDRYLNEIALKRIDRVIKEKKEKFYIDRNNFSKHPIAIQRRFLREVFSRLGITGEGSNFRRIEILRDFVLSFRLSKPLNLAFSYTARGEGRNIVIEKYIPQKKQRLGVKRQAIPLGIPGETKIKGLEMTIKARFSKKPPSLKEIKRASPGKVFLDAEKIKLPLYVRERKPGDSFTPLGMKGRVKLKRYFINAKIPRERRGFIPLVVSGKDIIWVGGYAVSEKARVMALTKEVLVLSLKNSSQNFSLL